MFVAVVGDDLMHTRRVEGALRIRVGDIITLHDLGDRDRQIDECSINNTITVNGCGRAEYKLFIIDGNYDSYYINPYSDIPGSLNISFKKRGDEVDATISLYAGSGVAHLAPNVKRISVLLE